MNYCVYDPLPELQPFVKCFWTLDDDGSSALKKQRVVPDGCMEMIFHCGDLYCQYFDDGNSEIQPRSFIFGQITRYIEIAPLGKSEIVAARFLPEGLKPFLPSSVIALENKAIGLEAIFGVDGAKLEIDVMRAPGTMERNNIIGSFLLSRLSDPRTIDSITKACVESIFQTQGLMNVSELADKMQINRRRMERRFTSMIGMSPKQLSKVARLQAAIKILRQKKHNNLTSLAHESGYYDQAHFIKDFREFTGISPKEFFADNMKLSSLFVL